VTSDWSVERQLPWRTTAQRHIRRSTVEATYAPKVHKTIIPAYAVRAHRKI